MILSGGGNDVMGAEFGMLLEHIRSDTSNKILIDITASALDGFPVSAGVDRPTNALFFCPAFECPPVWTKCGIAAHLGRGTCVPVPPGLARRP
jgi:hypothetical protein